MPGWFSGSTRRRNSSVFSCSARASWCRPSKTYVAATLFIASPRTERVKSHVQPTATIVSNLCPDGSPAAHVAETPASSPSAQEHLGDAQGHRTCWQDCALRCLQKNVSNHTSNQQPQSYQTYVRMVLRQCTSLILQNSFMYHNRFVVPPLIKKNSCQS